ncbi:MAG: hypothetical protein J5809_00935 [Selenomonadaceae bacterium]|nr:hypothetical protein [Selenomonadaceae bacterium]
MEIGVIQLFEDEGFRVRCRLEKDGTACFNVEDVGYGLGITQFKNGVEYVRIERINSYLKEFGFPHAVGKDDFIPENFVYRLAMKANNDNAKKFQEWIANVVVPSIRKNGYYILPNAAAADTLDMEKIHCMLKCAALTNLDRLRNQILREVMLELTGKKF